MPLIGSKITSAVSIRSCLAASFMALSACSVDGGAAMDNRKQPAFNNPALQRAAVALLAGDSDAALAEASNVKGQIDAVDPQGATLLKIAIRRNDERAVKGLLSLNANPNVPRDAAPIAAAAELANTTIVQSLLDAGADPNGATNGESALWRAAVGDRREVAELLLKHGAQIDRGDVDGETPAMAAVQASHFQMAIFLLQRGASPSTKSFEGKSLSYWARQSRINPDSDEGRAREQLLAMLASAGIP